MPELPGAFARSWCGFGKTTTFWAVKRVNKASRLQGVITTPCTLEVMALWDAVPRHSSARINGRAVLSNNVMLVCSDACLFLEGLQSHFHEYQFEHVLE